jgi:cell division protein FtsB
MKHILKGNTLLACCGVNGGILALAPVFVWRGSRGHIERCCCFRFMNFFGWDQKTLRRNAIFAMALLSLVMLMHEIFGRNGYMTLRHEKKQFSALQQQIQTVSEENKQLEQKIQALKNNPAAVEKQARDQLHLAKPGEVIYMLPGKAVLPTSTASSQPAPGKSQSHR